MSDVMDDLVGDDDLDLDLDDLVLEEDFTETLAPEGFYRLRVLKVQKSLTKANDKYPPREGFPDGGQNRVGIMFEILKPGDPWHGTKFWNNYYLGNPYGKRSWIEAYWYMTGADLQQKGVKTNLARLLPKDEVYTEVYGFVKHKSSTREGLEDPETGETATLVITDGYEVTRFDKFPDVNGDIEDFDEPL